MDALPTHFALAQFIFGIGSVIWGLEYLVVRREIGSTRILSWDVGQLRYQWTSLGGGESISKLVYGERTAMAWAAARIAAGACLLVPGLSTSTYALGFATAAVSSVGWFLRTPQGQDGSDQIFLLVSVSLALCYAIDTRFAYLCGSAFIAAQLAICYVTAGVTKLLSREWRDGRAIHFVFRTQNYGNGWVYRLAARHQAVALMMAWGVIIFEIAFPIVFVLDYKVAVAVLIVPLAFHLATAVFMGLNLFFISFLSTYPLLLFALKERVFGALL